MNQRIIIAITGIVVLLLCLAGHTMATAVTGTNPMATDQLVPANVTADDIGTAAGTWDAICTGDTIPASMTAGSSYGVSITMQNTGTGTWTSGKKIKLGTKNTAATLFGPKRVSTTGTITPGWANPYAFTVTAPQSAGIYKLVYRMVKDGRRKVWFGQTFTHYVTVTGSSDANTLATDIFTQTNTVRGSLPDYGRNGYLDAIAATHSMAMAKSHKFSHDGAGDGRFTSRLTGWSSAGENIAFVSSANPGNLGGIADQMMDMWVEHDAGSAWGHRLNILDGEHSDAKTSRMLNHPYDWTLIGVGAAYGKCNIGGRLWSGWFVTQDFARP